MNNFFNQELLLRLVSVLVFVPLVTIPIIYSNYASLLVYLIITSIICCEITEIKLKAKNIYIFNFYLIIVIIAFFLFLFLLICEEYSFITLMLIILNIWLFDTFSFLGGRIIKGKKLMPKISSGKTFSGLFVGIFMTLIINEMLLNFLFFYHNLNLPFVIFIIFMSFVGDTSVSLLKRQASIKDSGNIMPGHGGLLDRFDSFIMVFFVLGIINLVI